MELKIDRLVSPIGEILLVCDGEALAALDFIEAEARQARNLRRRQPSAELVPGPAPRFIRTRLEAYFAGEEADLDAIPVKTGGTAFQERVWAALREIRFGQTTSYGKLAATLGMPTACRAVGMANGANPVSIVVPCHRVIGSDGTLTGYGGGIERKRWLLDHEGAAFVRPRLAAAE